ncbi:MAG: PD40 domain-containing protein [Muribaculaceae bacterium]|nr:PD40 domain-containing protein [Muribaculaceae bacterium]
MPRITSVLTVLIALIIGIWGNERASAAPKKPTTAAAALQAGRAAFLNYDFEEAEEMYDQYRKLKTKAKQPFDEDFELWEAQLATASGAFDRVQKIVIIDSIALPRDSFFEAYKLATSAGSVGKPENMVLPPNLSGEEAAFINESGDYLIVSEPNTEGYLRLIESRRLLDGTWETKEMLKGNFEIEGDYAYPFLSADGQTLYFASNGSESMGGYDLFVAQKDPISGEFLQPLNLGMPFNSPYDDLMLAIDEENGLGWWATDRNSDDDNVTVYVYLIDDIRKNYPSDTEDLIDMALITDYKATWEEGKEKFYKEKLNSLPTEINKEEKKKEEFVFPLGNGKIYYQYSDFRNRKAMDLMKQYMGKKRDLDNKEKNLYNLRNQYKANKALKTRVIELEKEIETQRDDLSELRGQILRLEKSSK